MDGEITAKGRLTDDRHIELDEPLKGLTGQVEVVVRPAAPAVDTAARFEFLDRLLAAIPTTGESAEQVVARIAEGRRERGEP
jgi:hypothetical protein